MNTNKPTMKKMPHSCTKGQLYDMYCLDMSRRYIRNAINTIIKENRGLDKFHQVKLWHVAPKELQEFIDTYGLPRGYEK